MFKCTCVFITYTYTRIHIERYLFCSIAPAEHWFGEGGGVPFTAYKCGNYPRYFDSFHPISAEVADLIWGVTWSMI